jgi:hypothetical protein
MNMKPPKTLATIYPKTWPVNAPKIPSPRRISKGDRDVFTVAWIKDVRAVPSILSNPIKEDPSELKMVWNIIRSDVNLIKGLSSRRFVK